jgi:hypothetical protein
VASHLNEKHSIEMKQAEQRYETNLNEKDAEIASLKEHIRELEGIIADVGEVYDESLRQGKASRRFVAEMKQNNDRLFALLSKHYQSVLSLESEASANESEALRKEPKLWAKLQQHELNN